MLDHFSYSRVASSMWHTSSILSWVKHISKSESVLTLSLTTSSGPFCLHPFLATSQLSHDAADNSCQYFGLTKLYEDGQAVPKCIRKQVIKAYFQRHKLWKMSITVFKSWGGHRYLGSGNFHREAIWIGEAYDLVHMSSLSNVWLPIYQCRHILNIRRIPQAFFKKKKKAS